MGQINQMTGMITHSFVVALAVKYGMLEAILINHFLYWLSKNEREGINYYDGKYWSFQKLSTLEELYPYVGRRTIERALQHLVDENVLVKGNYNDSKMNRTIWYSFSDEFIAQNGEMHFVNLTKSDYDKMTKSSTSDWRNALRQNDENKKDISIEIYKHQKDISIPEDKAYKSSLREDMSHTGWDYQICINEWNSLSSYGIPAIKDIKQGTERERLVAKRSKQYTMDDYRTAIENIRESTFLQGVNDKGWTVTFDWFIKPNNFAKVLEGNYGNRVAPEANARQKTEEQKHQEYMNMWRDL